MDDARAIWVGLRARPAFAATHHRDELQDRLWGRAENELSDDDLIDRIRGILDDLGGATSSQADRR